MIRAASSSALRRPVESRSLSAGASHTPVEPPQVPHTHYISDDFRERGAARREPSTGRTHMPPARRSFARVGLQLVLWRRQSQLGSYCRAEPFVDERVGSPQCACRRAICLARRLTAQKLTLRVDHDRDLTALIVGDRNAVFGREELVATDLRHLFDDDVRECLETRLTGHR
jgi:hypothetical protein